VNIGDIVTYEELNGNKSIWKTYLISEKPSSPENGIINWQTAVASELINSEKGEELTLDLPKGETKIVVREIKKQNKDG
jgi:transcription elongation GreA/GreB family factor